MTKNNNPIALFDSGIGGLTVLKAVREVLPDENIIYYADTAHLPYGNKTPEQINGYVREIAEFMLTQNIKLLLMACNTSSALAIENLRKWYPIPVIGIIEPAVSIVKQHYTPDSKIGVIATPATIASGVYQRRLANEGFSPFAEPAPQLVPAIEGNMGDEYIDSILREYIGKLPDDISALILGCTHYPIVEENISRIVPSGCDIINPAMAQAYQAREYLVGEGLLSHDKSYEKFFVSGDTDQFRLNSAKILQAPGENIHKISLPVQS